MKLKSIEMQGFKSFPDKTRITFDDGVTAIIGPNGSGKSNISDAVRWVLGEMSMKSLRGSKMEDVIFNGTPNRPAANFSSVSLTLDTTAEYDRHAQTFMALSEEDKNADEKKDEYKLHHGTEVTITRKYYRSGESEYYINKKQVRLKDIYELFYDTGIGREGYSVISQGKISEVLSQKGHERRDIFEEAAGISKFRYKKAEAERKLAETENNLIRINDISCGDLTQKDVDRIAQMIKTFPLTANGTKGWNSAQVTCGGVVTKDFDPKTMESKRHKGLFAAGEVLNVTGDCGGFNLQWAWTSAYLAGIAMGEDDR